jgi:hypothetical protein
MTDTTTERVYKIKHSEKCFRFKPDAFSSHAPPVRGIYELVTFDDNQQAQVLYVGAAFDKTILESLEGHALGTLAPAATDLFAQHPNLYFDYLSEMTAKTLDDAQDVYWWLVDKHRPIYNTSEVKPSDRPGAVRVIELD